MNSPPTPMRPQCEGFPSIRDVSHQRSRDGWGSVLVALLLVDVLGEPQGVEEAVRGTDTRSLLEARLEGR